MRDEFTTFIQKSVDLVATDYYELMFETKRTFFEYLQANRSLADFKEATELIWANVDHSFMEQTLEQFMDMIGEANLAGHEIINPNAKLKDVFELTPTSKFQETEAKYKATIDSYYKSQLKNVEKDYVDTNSYLSEIVEKYTDYENTIPYFHKDGTVASFHNIASYNSMVYNTNLTRAGWNRTSQDAQLLGKDLLYLVAHPYACDKCREFQGKIYSKSGKNKKYPSQESAIKGGVGHPNCKHQWSIYFGEDQIQSNTYTSEEWGEKYNNQQKIRALNLEIKKAQNDISIYWELGNQAKVDSLNQRISKYKEKIKELS